MSIGIEAVAPPPTMLRMVPPHHKGEGDPTDGPPASPFPFPLWEGGIGEAGGLGVEGRHA